ncbi:type II toxin-antitoxin system RelE/ParE family toxin [Cupriavidus sp. UME77]|uniref:type II toxin-antitoxin system RelE/ParE family toxin n=1 Tax=Cupriavidus sp. UME77 TaxID=1862321 RepID=UPI00160000F4|nr:type II toxin-antitoxin system RelE/ParE family toxin [Cupriavidus sp. UME77]MBB1632853.1 addiction module antitoxin RelB [Cupriavidus sp. UME77]
MTTLNRTAEFSAWISTLRDLTARAKILVRLKRAEQGNFGDSEPIGDGLSEMRIDFGPGYRIYYGREGAVAYLLISGGDKSTQKADIK